MRTYNYEECSKFSHEMIVFPFFFTVPYITPIRMTISPRSERIVRILHLIEQLQRHYLALDSVSVIYGVRSTCYTISNPLFLNVGIREWHLYTQRLTCMFAGCCVANWFIAWPTVNFVVSILRMTEASCGFCSLHSDIVARIIWGYVACNGTYAFIKI